jgi:hypothetical protein
LTDRLYIGSCVAPLRSMPDNPFRGLAELAVNTIHFEWGWAVLLLGAILVISGAAVGTDAGIAD